VELALVNLISVDQDNRNSPGTSIMPKIQSDKSPYSVASFRLSNFAIQYNFGSIAIALIIMSSSICTSTQEMCDVGKQAGWVTGTSNATILVGAIVGQLGMGKLGDLLGRNTAFLSTMTLTTFGCLLSAIVPHGSPDAIYGGIIACRFLLGLGLGGVYPLSATKASEDGGSSDGNTVSSQAAGWAFFWQMPGVMGPFLLAYLIAVGGTLSVNASWRLVLGFGAVPSGGAMIMLITERWWLAQNRRENMGDGDASPSSTQQQQQQQQQLQQTGAGLSAQNLRDQAHRAHNDPAFAGVVQEKRNILRGHEALGQDSPTSSDNTMDLSNNANSAHPLAAAATGHHHKDEVPAPKGREASVSMTRTSISSLTTDRSASRRSYQPERPSMLVELKEEYAQDPHLIKRFLVSGITWLLFDIVVYGIGLFGPEIIFAITSDGSRGNISSHKTMKHLASSMLLVQAMGLPATVLGINLMPYMSLRTMQATGFASITVICAIFGVVYNALHDSDPNALYGIFVVVGFFMQFLVNVTTFVMPAAVFRKEVRATFNGISAALGKIGAVIGAFVFPVIGQSGRNGVVIIMVVCVIAGICGAVITYKYCLDDMINDGGGNAGRPISYSQHDTDTDTNTDTGAGGGDIEMELGNAPRVVSDNRTVANTGGVAAAATGNPIMTV
jgi:MFS family permease